MAETHWDVAGACTASAGSRWKKAEWEKAERLTEESLDIKRKVIGEKHASTAWAMHRLSVIHRKLGQFDTAVREADGRRYKDASRFIGREPFRYLVLHPAGIQQAGGYAEL